MIIPKIIKICPGCNEPLRGCACQFVEAPDGVKVHSACLDKYKQKILAVTIKSECAYCKAPLPQDSYFKAIDGAAVHFACMQKYEKLLIKK